MEKDISVEILSDIIVYMKYAKYLSEKKRRETWYELVTRNKEMHIKRFPQLKKEIEDAYKYVYDKKVFPSARSLQFAGKPIELNNARLFNCSYLPMDHPDAFSELMFLLLAGCGVGYSVQKHHIAKLPNIVIPKKTRRFLVADSIEGWAEAVKVLINAYFGQRKALPIFDFRDIRPKGTPLKTSGGKAPGYQPLAVALHQVRMILESHQTGERLTPLEVHTINCYLSDAVLSGGIRRSAMICLFSFDDYEMRTCKFGNWWETNPERGRANNSAVIDRSRVTEEDFTDYWKLVKDSNSGEPGFFFTNNVEMGLNPCCLTGENKIRTIFGDMTIEDAYDKHVSRFVSSNGAVVDGKVFFTGVKPVLQIKTGSTSDYTTFRTTPDHKFMTVNKQVVEAKDLKGCRLMPFFELKEISKSLATKYGFVFGDGSFRKNSKEFKNFSVSFSPEKDAEVKLLFEKTGWSKSPMSYTVNVTYDEMQEFGINTTERCFERTFPHIEDDAELCDFLTGLYSADGCVIKGHRVALKTTSIKAVEGILAALKRIGIKHAYCTTNKPTKISWPNGDYVSKESYDVNISREEDIITFANKISFIQGYKVVDLVDLIKTKAPYVFSVKEDDTALVYDFSLFSENHWGVINGCVVHNCEISLYSTQFCNLSTINVSDIETQEEFNNRARAASFIGTLQAAYTNFHFLRDEWIEQTEKEALIGVSMTGTASSRVMDLNFKEAAEEVKKENEKTASKIGINSAARTTCQKPEGTLSNVCGTSSGVHAWHSQYYIRRVRVNKEEPIYQYLVSNHPELVEDDRFKPAEQAVISIPIKAPENAVFRDETALQFLSRFLKLQKNWVRNGHRAGDNFNNISATLTIKDNEWDRVGKWLWENREHYTAISVLPYDGGTYVQAPFEEITKEKYEEMVKHLKKVDLTKIVEEKDNTTLKENVACGGGACEL